MKKKTIFIILLVICNAIVLAFSMHKCTATHKYIKKLEMVVQEKEELILNYEEYIDAINSEPVKKNEKFNVLTEQISWEDVKIAVRDSQEDGRQDC